MKKLFFKDIKFLDLKDNEFIKVIKVTGLFVFPSGPGLASINQKKNYYESLKKAELVFFDSGLFVLLLKIFKNIKVNKFSGFKFLQFFFRYLKNNNNKSIFCIDPNTKFSKSNKMFFKELGINKINNYIAPKYNSKNIYDKLLLAKINYLKPDFILTNIGGGKQEILGLFLKDNLEFKTTIICTGGALSFFTGDQAPINTFVDRYYLGWLVRLIFNPIIFCRRFIYALKLIPMVAMNNIKLKR
jgi:exopolysaccharide biosynthesis WecB/TagA/CpsF family protein